MLWHVSICLRGITVWRHTGRTARQGRAGPRPGRGGGRPGGRGAGLRGPETRGRRARTARVGAPPRVFGMENICWPAMWWVSDVCRDYTMWPCVPGERGRWAAAGWLPRPASETDSAARHRRAPPPLRAPPGRRSPRGWCGSWGGPEAPPRCCTACRSNPDRASSYRCKAHLWHKVLSWWDLKRDNDGIITWAKRGGGWQGGGGERGGGRQRPRRTGPGPRGSEAGQLVSLEQLEISGGQPHPGGGHVGVIHEGGTRGVLAVGVATHWAPGPGAVARVAREAGDGARQAEGGVEVQERGGARAEGAQGEVLGVTREDLQPAAHDGGGAGRVRAARWKQYKVVSWVRLLSPTWRCCWLTALVRLTWCRVCCSLRMRYLWEIWTQAGQGRRTCCCQSHSAACSPPPWPRPRCSRRVWKARAWRRSPRWGGCRVWCWTCRRSSCRPCPRWAWLRLRARSPPRSGCRSGPAAAAETCQPGHPSKQED